MSLFGSLMADVEDDPFFGSHMRHMRQMNSMMGSLFPDPFGILGGDGSLAIMGPGPRRGTAMVPFMPQMPNMNRLFPDGVGLHSPGSSFSSSTLVMSSGPGGKPQVYSSSSSTKIGPHGIKETCKTVQDSRTGTKKMAIGHHIGERAHVIEREQNYYTGDAEERQDFINIEEEEAEDFDREFQYKANSGRGPGRGSQPALCGPRADGRGERADGRGNRQLALPAPPAQSPQPAHAHSPHAMQAAHAHSPHSMQPAHAHSPHVMQPAHAHSPHAMQAARAHSPHAMQAAQYLSAQGMQAAHAHAHSAQAMQAAHAHSAQAMHAAQAHTAQALQAAQAHSAHAMQNAPPAHCLPPGLTSGLPLTLHGNIHTSSESASVRRPSSLRPASRRPIRTAASPLTLPTSPSMRQVYGGSQPQRHRARHHKPAHRQPAPPQPPQGPQGPH